MAEKYMIRSKALVLAAENLRVAKRYGEARDIIGDIGSVRLIGLSDRPLEEKQRLLSSARISVSSSISMARRAWNADSIERQLSQAKRVIDDVYDDPEVQKVARRVRTG